MTKNSQTLDQCDLTTPWTSTNAFIDAYIQKTAGSQKFAAEHRSYHVDKSSIALGAASLTDQLAYPIVVDRAEGAYVWDIDGNHYVDILQGLGANLFGHNPDFVREAIENQLVAGFPIGLQNQLVGEVAQLLVKLTGMPRICFSNTGTEAIMTAIRVARAKSGRSRIVLFTDSYHGHADTVLMRAPLIEYARKKIMRRFGHLPLFRSLLSRTQSSRAVPASPGIPNSIAKDVLVLEYGNPKSIDLIKSYGSQLAAVLVEPVQSRCPELQPRDFLHELRTVTLSCGAALVFDEMVTGFRVHPGGAQAYFDVEADLATYSKVVGGGLPLSVLAGRHEYMDFLQPRDAQDIKTVFFAGTFCKHPLSLAASHAVLHRLVDAGPLLQEQLNRRTQELVVRLNAMTAQEEIPIQFSCFGSFFSISLRNSEIAPEQISWLSYRLLYEGVHLRGGDRGGFLTTAHSNEDIEKIYNAFQVAVQGLAAERKTPSRHRNPDFNEPSQER